MSNQSKTIECYSYMNNRKLDYKWIIKNFTYYLDFISNEQSYVIKSPVFDIDGHEECKFYLEMTISTNGITCSFQLTPCTGSLKLKCLLSVLDNLNEVFQTVNIKIHYCASRFCILETPTLKIQKEDLFKRRSELLSGDKLRVVCKLTLYDEDTTIGQIFVPKHHQTMKDHFKELLDSQTGSDVIFKVDNKEFKVHKAVLIARSPVFSAMFSNDMIEKKSNRVNVEDISSSIFELLMEFIYTDEVTTELDVKTGMDLLRAASKYQLEGLETLCEVKLFNLLTVNNAMDILVVAERHNCTDLVESVNNFVQIHRKNIRAITKSEHFLKHPHHVFLLCICGNN